MLALQESETFSLYKREFDQLRREHAAVGDVPIRFLASEVRMPNERLLEALYVPVERRVLHRLVALSNLYAEPHRLVDPATLAASGYRRAGCFGAMRAIVRVAVALTLGLWL